MSDLAPNTTGRAGRVLRLAALLAALTGAAANLTLAVRPLSGADLGYHLAYGYKMLDTGRAVSDASFVYPPPTPDQPDGDQLGPGGYYDDAGNLRFVSDKWLTQVVFALVHKYADWAGLVTLRVLLVASILAMQGLILHRLGVHWAWLGPIWLATAACSYERFILRPELPGYLCALAHLWLLCGPITWRRVAIAAAVQVVAAGGHGYWVLDVAIAGAFLVAALVRLLTADPAQRQRLTMQDQPVVQRAKRLAICVGLLAAAPLLTPGTWRTVIFPIQTLSYLRTHSIAGAEIARIDTLDDLQAVHPWALIGEFAQPMDRDMPLYHTLTTKAYVALLAASAGAFAVLLVRRRWAPAMILAGYIAVSWSMRRNIAPAAMIAWPLVALAAAEGVRLFHKRPGRGGRASLRWVVAALLLATAVVGSAWSATIVTGRFYRAEGVYTRFGTGLDRLQMPVAAAAFLDEQMSEPQPVFVDHNSSSNVVFLSEKVQAAPTLTNTWAMPIGQMRQVFALQLGLIDPALLDAWGLDWAVIKTWRTTAPLSRRLLAEPGWAMVFADGWHLVFARRTPANASTIARFELTRASFDVDEYAARCAELSPADPAEGLAVAAGTIQHLQWFEHAAELWRRVIVRDPARPVAHLNLGSCRAELARAMLLAPTFDENDPADWEASAALYDQARAAYARALELRPNYPEARAGIDNMDQMLELIEPHRRRNP